MQQPPQKLQPVRRGSLPPKYGSGACRPSSPKKTPTGLGVQLPARPYSSAVRRSSSSDSKRAGFPTTPSIRRAKSNQGMSPSPPPMSRISSRSKNRSSGTNNVLP